MIIKKHIKYNDYPENGNPEITHETPKAYQEGSDLNFQGRDPKKKTIKLANPIINRSDAITDQHHISYPENPEIEF